MCALKRDYDENHRILLYLLSHNHPFKNVDKIGWSIERYKLQSLLYINISVVRNSHKQTETKLSVLFGVQALSGRSSVDVRYDIL